jgi:hypothetical protein
VTPASANLSADAAPLTFTANATDADGNPTPAAVTWSIASGPITSIDPVTGRFDPRAAGSGTIAATAGSAIGTASVAVAPGKAATLAVAPDTLDVVQGMPSVAFTATAADADGNATADLGAVTWSIASGPIGTIDTAGILAPASPGIGSVRASSSYGATDTSGAVWIRRPAALSGGLAVPASIPIGGQAVATLSVTNTGEVDALAVAPCVLAISGGASLVSGPSPASTAIPAGGNAVFSWTLSADVLGAVAPPAPPRSPGRRSRWPPRRHRRRWSSRCSRRSRFRP